MRFWLARYPRAARRRRLFPSPAAATVRVAGSGSESRQPPPSGNKERRPCLGRCGAGFEPANSRVRGSVLYPVSYPLWALSALGTAGFEPTRSNERRNLARAALRPLRQNPSRNTAGRIARRRPPRRWPGGINTVLNFSRYFLRLNSISFGPAVPARGPPSLSHPRPRRSALNKKGLRAHTRRPRDLSDRGFLVRFPSDGHSLSRCAHDERAVRMERTLGRAAQAPRRLLFASIEPFHRLHSSSQGRGLCASTKCKSTDFLHGATFFEALLSREARLGSFRKPPPFGAKTSY